METEIIKVEPNSKNWANIECVENGYKIKVRQQEYVAETKKKLLEILSKVIKEFK